MAFPGGGLVKAVALRRSIGVYVGDHEVTVCRAALGPLGAVELLNRTEPCTPETLAATLASVLRPLLPAGRSLRVPVSIGVPALRVFFATRAVRLTDKSMAPGVMLHEVLKSSDVNVDDMEVDLVRAQPGKKPLAVMVACRRKYLSSLLVPFEALGVRPHRTEPAPFALLRLAAARHRAPRKARTVVRLFLGPGRGLAVLAHSGRPLAWRAFELPEGGEAAAVGAAVKAIQIVARFRGEVGGCEAVMIHGRPDLAEALGGEALRSSLAVPVRHAPDPGYDGPSVALGLALGALEDDGAFDLSRNMKSRPTIWENLPVGDIALQTALLTCVTLFLGSRDQAVQGGFRRVNVEAARHAWMKKVDDAGLDRERKELGAKVDAVRQFLDTRVLWTGYTHDAPALLPETIVLQSLGGVNELESGKAKVKGKKSLTLKLATPIARGQAIPREIDAYLGALRRDPRLMREFPRIELADLRWSQPTVKGAQPVAQFTVNCLPPEKPRAPAGGPDPKKATGG